jgi:hypothetical protein
MTSRKATAAPKARSERLIVRQIEGEWLYYDLDSHKATCLNAFSARVLKLCDGQRTALGIAEALQPDEVGEDVVALTLDKLAKARLLDGSYEAAARPAARMSRRDMISNVGAGTLALVPVVSAITVPTPAQATSCLPNGDPCFMSSQCCSGICGNGGHCNS